MIKISRSSAFRKASASLVVIVALIQPVHASQTDEKTKADFLDAVIQGDAPKVKQMLSSDATLAVARDQKGVSAILKATYYGKKDVVAVLLGSGIELNIFEAAATGQAKRVSALIKRDASLLNAFSSDGFMPLGLAVFFGHPESVEVLLAAGAEVNVVTREKMKVTPLHSAAAARRAGIARMLIAHGANVNAAQEESGFTPLHEAALNGDIEFVTLLLDHGANIDARTKDGKTPLAYALSGGQIETAEFLRKRGAVR